MTDSIRQDARDVSRIPDRDRLYREWILPHLELSEEHRAFLEDTLNIADTRNFRSHPGHVHVPLDEAAPFDELAKLPCCVIRGASMTLTGPREGALLIPVQDVQGRLTAYQMLNTSQVESIKAGDSPGKIRWWAASGAPKPQMPNGECPLSVAKTGERTTTILCHALAGAQRIAAKWNMTAISTTEDEFSRETLNQYLTALQPDIVALLMDRQASRAVCQRAWDLCERLRESGWNLRILVPVLSDEEIPERFGACTLIPVDAWLQGLTESVQNQLLGKDASDQLNEYLQGLNQKRHISATTKIKMAYDQMKNDTESISINSLAMNAGVAWRTVRDWLDEQGISDTATLRSSAEEGWEPPEPDPTPLITTSPADADREEASEPEEDESMPLFEYAERQQAMTGTDGGELDPETPGADLEAVDKQAVHKASQAITAEILPENEYADQSDDDVEIEVEAEAVSVETEDLDDRNSAEPRPDGEGSDQTSDRESTQKLNDDTAARPDDSDEQARFSASPRLALILLAVLIITIVVILVANVSGSQPARLTPGDLPTNAELMDYREDVQLPVKTLPPPELGESPYDPDAPIPEGETGLPE